ncbi:MAG TPA: coproporphyrinogen III oxidase, partial [Richelia sp.]|nr:coproporphyrinogen III oxidase [Richelia sp.]
MVSAAYIHIPFCRRRCYYCDFPIFVIGDRLRGEISTGIQKYIANLAEEIKNTNIYGSGLRTVFFGGGTPSLLSVDQIHQVLAVLDQQFGICKDAEISMEIDPGTFNFIDISGFCHAGINRISLGVQAFQEELLQFCGRSHTLEDIFMAIKMIRQVKVPEFSMDLISGLPHQTLAIWQNSLEHAVEISPTHISIYDLTIESGTAFDHYFQSGKQPLPEDGTTVKMYCLARQILTDAGYEHYEISNYSQPGHQCRHNRVYWENLPYYGFGMGAASFLEGKRFTRPRKTQQYY